MSNKSKSIATGTHCFGVDDAVMHGVDAAVMLQVVKDCIDADEAVGRANSAMTGWTARTAEEFALLVPYFNRHKIQRLLIKLEITGSITSGYFNDDARDRTKWYSVTGGAK